MMNLFSVPLTGVIDLDYGGDRKLYPKIYDVTVNIENPGSNGQKMRIASDLPFPGLFIKPGREWIERNVILQDDSILVFANSDYRTLGWIESENAYWKTLKEVLTLLSDLYQGSTIYLKLHPGNSDKSQERLRNMGYMIIDRKISAEEIYISNGRRIRMVLATGSTSLITATWFGIPSYDCSELFAVSQEVITILRLYLSNAKGMQTVRSFSDLMVKSEPPEKRVASQESEIITDKAKWFKAIDEMERRLHPM